MDGAKLQAELAETKAELNRLKESLTVATPIVHKDLSLVSLVPKWSRSDSSISLEEFFSSIESAFRMGRWKDRDCVEIASLKVTDSAKSFYQVNVQNTSCTCKVIRFHFKIQIYIY